MERSLTEINCDIDRASGKVQKLLRSMYHDDDWNLQRIQELKEAMRLESELFQEHHEYWEGYGEDVK